MPQKYKRTGRPNGRPQSHIPDEFTRERVRLMAFAGIEQDRIAGAFMISKPTLTKYYRHELDNGEAGILGEVASKLYKVALDPGNVSPPSIDACKFILARRGGEAWRENNVTSVRVRDVTDEPLTAAEWGAKFAVKALPAPIEDAVFTEVQTHVAE